MIDFARLRRVVVMALAALALGAVLLSLTGPLRALLTFPWVLLGPGLAIAGLIRLRSPRMEAALIVPISLSVQTLLATLQVYLDAYTPLLVLVDSIVVGFAALVADLIWTSTSVDDSVVEESRSTSGGTPDLVS